MPDKIIPIAVVEPRGADANRAGVKQLGEDKIARNRAGFDSDVQLAIDTRRRLFSEWADQPILVFGGHYGPGYIKRDGAVFRFKTA